MAELSYPVVRLWFVLQDLRSTIKCLTKPQNSAVSLMADVSRRRSDLILKNALLRQQLVILRRQVKRPHLSNQDRLILVLLARLTRFWKQTLLIVQPDTLLRWHRVTYK